MPGPVGGSRAPVLAALLQRVAGRPRCSAATATALAACLQGTAGRLTEAAAAALLAVVASEERGGGVQADEVARWLRGLLAAADFGGSGGGGSSAAAAAAERSPPPPPACVDDACAAVAVLHRHRRRVPLDGAGRRGVGGMVRRAFEAAADEREQRHAGVLPALLERCAVLRLDGGCGAVLLRIAEGGTGWMAAPDLARVAWSHSVLAHAAAARSSGQAGAELVLRLSLPARTPDERLRLGFASPLLLARAALAVTAAAGDDGDRTGRALGRLFDAALCAYTTGAYAAMDDADEDATTPLLWAFASRVAVERRGVPGGVDAVRHAAWLALLTAAARGEGGLGGGGGGAGAAVVRKHCAALWAAATLRVAEDGFRSDLRRNACWGDMRDGAAGAAAFPGRLLPSLVWSCLELRETSVMEAALRDVVRRGPEAARAALGPGECHRVLQCFGVARYSHPEVVSVLGDAVCLRVGGGGGGRGGEAGSKPLALLAALNSLRASGYTSRRASDAALRAAAASPAQAAAVTAGALEDAVRLLPGPADALDALASAAAAAAAAAEQKGGAGAAAAGPPFARATTEQLLRLERVCREAEEWHAEHAAALTRIGEAARRQLQKRGAWWAGSGGGGENGTKLSRM